MNDLGYTEDPLLLTGVSIAFIGILIFCFGKKWFIFRWLLNDRSMFAQLFYGFIIFLIGCVLMYFSGFFNT